jgi:hypothetical protein
LLVVGAVRQLGISPSALEWSRQVKTTFVETVEQEHFVNTLPMVWSADIIGINKDLVQAGTVDLLIRQLLLLDSPTVHHPPSLDKQQQPQVAVFEMLDLQGDGSIDAEDMLYFMSKFGCADQEVLKQRTLNEFKAISLPQFTSWMVHLPPEAITLERKRICSSSVEGDDDDEHTRFNLKHL